MLSWRFVLGLMVACAGCGALPAPRDPATAALFRDLEREVSVSAAAGWGLDRLEIEGLLEPALDSVCRSQPLDRRVLLGWLDDQIAAAGGPVAQAWRDRGEDLSRVDDLLVLTRVRLLLARADAVADADCPFWIEPEPRFRGRQISNGRWQLTGGGGGKGIVVQQDGRRDLRFGAAGRLLFGRVFEHGGALYAGLELGGSASFPRNPEGERGALEFAVDVVVPVVARFTLVNSYLELEAGWLGRSLERELTALKPGLHVGVSVGARALRARFVFPGAVFGVSLERTFLEGSDPLVLKFGARFALDLDL